MSDYIGVPERVLAVVLALLIGFIAGFCITAALNQPEPIPWYEKAPIPIIGCDYT